MKLLQMIPAFYPASAYGGTVEVAYRLSKELVKRGHEVTVYTSDTLDKNHRVENFFSEIDGIKVYYFRNLSNSLAWKRLVFNPTMIYYLNKQAKNFDIIHLHGPRNFQNIVAHFFSKKYGTPYVLHAHGSLSKFLGKQSVKNLYDILFGYELMRDASNVIAFSESEAEMYLNMGVHEKKIFFIPNGIELENYSDLPEKGLFKHKIGVPKDKKIILYLGRLHRIKGIDFLLKGYSIMTKKRRPLDNLLVIAGSDDGYLSELKKLTRFLGISNRVIFTGLLTEKEKISAYVDSNICAYLGCNEPFGLVSLESAACRTPVLVSSGTYMADIVNKGNFGFSVNYGDANELAEVMNLILSSNDLQRIMGQKGRKFVFENHDWSKIINRIESVYFNTLK